MHSGAIIFSNIVGARGLKPIIVARIFSAMFALWGHNSIAEISGARGCTSIATVRISNHLCILGPQYSVILLAPGSLNP